MKNSLASLTHRLDCLRSPRMGKQQNALQWGGNFKHFPTVLGCSPTKNSSWAGQNAPEEFYLRHKKSPQGYLKKKVRFVHFWCGVPSYRSLVLMLIYPIDSKKINSQEHFWTWQSVMDHCKLENALRVVFLKWLKNKVITDHANDNLANILCTEVGSDSWPNAGADLCEVTYTGSLRLAICVCVCVDLPKRCQRPVPIVFWTMYKAPKELALFLKLILMDLWPILNYFPYSLTGPLCLCVQVGVLLTVFSFLLQWRSI